ncbi:hypothetical protein OUZ56_010410 [Daphnia magna]|uniref:Uncharacterized protein n=1 Tax=Daphnia magna TaxID=35525 RepID=A0ABR0AIG4_9CRUS|nr:hypothetical protein OUZ56_010410 [Daphnia magna]
MFLPSGGEDHDILDNAVTVREIVENVRETPTLHLVIALQGVNHGEEFHPHWDGPNRLERSWGIKSGPNNAAVERRKVSANADFAIVLWDNHDRVDPQRRLWHFADDALVFQRVQLLFNPWH